MSLDIEPTSRRLSLVTGLDYHLLEWNAESDATHTVFLVHGFLDLAWGWARTVEAWMRSHPAAARELHLVAPDMRGHGDSDRIGKGGYYHFLDYLGDMRDLVEKLGRERISLVGHSMGGSICAYYAGSFPPIHRLALLEGWSPLETPLDMPKRVRTWLTSWQRARTRPSKGCASVAEAAERLQRHDPLLSPERALELAQHSTRPREDGRLSFKHDPLHLTVGPYPFRLDMAASFWGAIACPVLFVEGDQSTFRHRAEETQRRRAMFGGTVQDACIEGAGHMMQRHQPQAIADLLDRFIRSDDGGSATG